jgi:hypothetical protein
MQYAICNMQHTAYSIPNLLLVFIAASLFSFWSTVQRLSFSSISLRPAVDFYATKQCTTIIDLLADALQLVL